MNLIHEFAHIDPIVYLSGVAMCLQGAYQGTRRRNAAIAAAKRRHPSARR